MSKKNAMGSDVVEGFSCKPKELDADKPIMYSAAQIFICEGSRCKDKGGDDLADKIRGIIKDSGYDKGEKRIKLTRTLCQGACRYRTFMCAYRRESSYSAWKKVHKWTKSQWAEFIQYLADGIEPRSIMEFRVEEKIFSEREG